MSDFILVTGCDGGNELYNTAKVLSIFEGPDGAACLVTQDKCVHKVRESFADVVKMIQGCGSEISQEQAQFNHLISQKTKEYDVQLDALKRSVADIYGRLRI